MFFLELNSLKSSLTSGPSSYPSLPSPRHKNERFSPMTASSFRYIIFVLNNTYK